MEMLRESLGDAPVLIENGYEYFVHPITDGVPVVDPILLDEVIDSMLAVGDFDCDIILAPESMGIPLAVPLSMRLGIPYSIIRKRRYGLPGEICITQHTGYSETDMYINGVRAGDKVTIVDDVISTGGTLAAVIGALRENGVHVVDAITVFDKGGVRHGSAEHVKSLLRVSIVNGKVCVH